MLATFIVLPNLRAATISIFINIRICVDETLFMRFHGRQETAAR